MDREMITNARRIAGRALRETSRAALALNARVAPWSVPAEAEYSELWMPGDTRQARALIMNDEDEAAFARTGRQDADRIAELVEPGDTVLDYGCGIGRVARHVAPRCERLWAVDVSDRMLAMAAAEMRELANVRFARSTGTAVPAVPDGSVDVVYSLLVLQHAEREDAFLILRDLRRMLRPGGTAFLTYPNLLSEAYLAAFLEYADTGQSRNRARARLYTPQEVERLVPAAGFRIISIDPGENIVVVASPA